MFPFRNTQKARAQSMSKTPFNTSSAMKDSMKSANSTVSYWAGMRIEGPIKPHEKKEVFMTKLQTQWYAGGLFGPRMQNGMGRMV